MANVHTCTHIRATGVRCGSPALRAEQFCYFHQRMHRGVRTPPQARLHPVANFEDEESIQLALMEVTNALMRNTIDLKRATLILRALHIAVKNASRVKYPLHANHMVKEIPDYAGPTLHDRQAAWDMRMPGEKPPQTRTAAERFAAEGYPPPGKIQTREEYIKQVYGYDDVDEFLTVERAKFEKEAAENAAAEKAAAAAARVGADTFVRPGGEAAVSHPESLPPQDFKTNSAQASPQGLSHPSRFSKAGNSDPSRKPAASVKEVNAAAAESSRRERKIAARSLS